MRKHYLATVAGAALLAIGGTGTAHAVPAYAFADLIVDNINIATLDPSEIISTTVTLNSAAGYPGSSGMVNSVAGDPTTGGDSGQATSGPATFPASGTFTTQALLGSSSGGTRGQAEIIGPFSGVAAQKNVSEGILLTNGSASSIGGSTTGMHITVVVGSTQTFSLTYSASSLLEATTVAPGDGASSETNASFTVTDGGTGTPLFTYAPPTLNEAVTATGVDGMQYILNPSTVYTSPQFTLEPGQYQFNILAGTQERLQAAAPEPLSLALLGTGLFGLGAVRRLRRK